MKLKRPKAILVLVVVFSWSLWKCVDLLVRGSNSADRVLYDEAGIGWLAVTLLAGIALLDAAALKYLIRPTPVGRFVCLASIALSAVQTSIAFAIARVSPDIARRAFVVSRESRGLPASPEVVDLAMSPTISLLLWAGSLLISAILAFLVIRCWNYFAPPSAMTSQQATT